METPQRNRRSAQVKSISETDSELEGLAYQATQVEEFIEHIRLTKDKLAELRKEARQVKRDKEFRMEQKLLEEEQVAELAIRKVKELQRRKDDRVDEYEPLMDAIECQEDELSELEDQFSTNPDLLLKKAGVYLTDFLQESQGEEQDVSNSDWCSLGCVDSVSADFVRRDTAKRVNEVGNSVAVFGQRTLALQSAYKYLCFAVVTGPDGADNRIKLTGQGETLAKAIEDIRDRLRQFTT